MTREELASIVGDLYPTLSVVEEIYKERRRQVGEEGYDASHDDGHPGEMALAAACYAFVAGGHGCGTDAVYPAMYPVNCPPSLWPWSGNAWKPKSRRRDLIRAAALIVAEIERLDRGKKARSV